MKVYVAAKPSGAVVGVYKSLTGAQVALKIIYRWLGSFEHEPGLWRYPNGLVIQSFELEDSKFFPGWECCLEPEQLRPRGATVNVTINYEGLNLEAMVKEAVDKALSLREWVTIMQGVTR